MSHAASPTTETPNTTGVILARIGGVAGLYVGRTCVMRVSESDYWPLSSSRPALRAFAWQHGYALAPQSIDD